MHRVIVRIILSASMFAMSAVPSLAQLADEKRVALVIGNSAYQDAPLKRPVGDARAMAAQLRQLGFDVVLRENATLQDMVDAVEKFAQKLSPGAAALIYYSGHGVQARGRNYLIPVDATLGNWIDLRFQAVSVSSLSDVMDQALSRVSFLILDACRNNPFDGRLRGASRGLATMDAARGRLVAYAAAPGSVAADGDDGIYTSALLKALAVPGLEAGEMFRRVHAKVAEDTRNEQTPWESSSLAGEFVFNLTASTAPAAPRIVRSNRESLLFRSAQASDRVEEYLEYVNQFPNGTFAGLARERIASLQGAARPPQLPAAHRRTVLAAKPGITIEPIDRVLVATTAAWLRAEPDLTSPVVATLKEGQSVHVLGKVKGQYWYQVERMGRPPAYITTVLLTDAAARPSP